MSWDKVKNWVFGGAGAAALVICYQFMTWQVSVIVKEEIAKLDIGTDAKIVSMDDEIDANTAGVLSNKEKAEITQRQLEQVANILMRSPE